MADYAALIAAWNGATQPPTGVTGTGLTGGMTTAQKIAAVNGWIITGTIPTSFFVTGDQLLNCINYSEFKLLTATEQANLLGMLRVSGPLLAGSSQTSHMAAGMIVDLFLTLHSGPNTIAALTALAHSTVTPWWQVPVASGGGGLDGPVGLGYVNAAGLS